MPEQKKFTGTTPLFIAPFEVVVHNKPTDCWVSFLGKVCDITPILKRYEGENCIKPLLAHAGKDISNWFDAKTGDIQHYVHPVTGVRVPYCPFGRLPDVQYQVPSSKWRPVEVPWWKDERYIVGKLTKKVRPLKIINTLIAKEVHLSVCCEDTFLRIMERYSIFSSDPGSYTWRYQNKNLIMTKTLEENGIMDNRDYLGELGLSPNMYIPSIFLYYNDDFKWENLSDSSDTDGDQGSDNENSDSHAAEDSQNGGQNPDYT